jgi:hypothetical protein
LRHQWQQILNGSKGNGLKAITEVNNEEYSGFKDAAEGSESPCFEDANVVCASTSLGELKPEQPENMSFVECMEEDINELAYSDPCIVESESSDSESSDEDDPGRISVSGEENSDPDSKFTGSTSFKADFFKSSRTSEEFATWQRIIRLDAIRSNTEWIMFSRDQAEVSKESISLLNLLG